MKKTFSFFVVIFIISALISPVFLRAENQQETIQFLKNQTQDPWVTQALVAASATGIINDHLKNVSGTLATDYAKTILALSALGEDSRTFGNIDYIAKLKTFYNNNQFGDANLLNDDVWSILALASVGEKDLDKVQAAKNFIISHQNTDGGWSYAVSGESDTNDTAAVIIALVEAGVSSSDAVIVNAVSYLQSAQNTDGGFGWSPGSQSDSGSDSWVITALNKLNIDPASWDKNGQTPLTHLLSLEDSDGGFWWLAPGTSDFNNKAMTAFAAIAIADKSFPIGYYTNSNSSYKLRIEGKDNLICNVQSTRETVLEAVKAAALDCNYTYEIEETSFGPYLKKINNEEAAGMSGWMYFVNNISPAVGMADYQPENGDEVLIYYGDWGWAPLQISTDKSQVNTDETFTLSVKYFDGSTWQALSGATIHGLTSTTDSNGLGLATASFVAPGVYTVWAEKSNYVRSNPLKIKVGNGIGHNVNLSVEVVSGGVQVGGEAVIFSVTPTNLNFGSLQPGQISEKDLHLENSGTIDLEISAVVNGDDVLKQNLKLGSTSWQDFSLALPKSVNQNTKASLTIPSNYIGSGVKTGELIIWASY